MKALLAELFTVDELERFVDEHYPMVQGDVAWGGPLNRVVFELTGALARRGAVNDVLRERLMAARPDKKDDIQRVFGPVPMPTYTNDQERSWGEQLQALYERRASMRSAGEPTTKIDAEIAAIKRAQRSRPELVAGDQLSDRYKLLRPLGAGGFAKVWEAYDGVDRRRVAVKVLHGQHASSGERSERFFRGARLMRELDHPNVVRVFDPRCEDDGYRYFVMELLTGGDLRSALQTGPMQLDAALDLIDDIAGALAVAHGQACVHRDVKPANILLTREGVPKLSDFDLVRAADSTGGTRTGALGTFLYAAPEALSKAKDAGPPADVYGLALTAVAVLVGREPEFVNKFNPALLVAGLDVSAAVVDVLQSALSVDPEARPADAGRLQAALRSARSSVRPSTDRGGLANERSGPKPGPAAAGRRRRRNRVSAPMKRAPDAVEPQSGLSAGRAQPQQTKPSWAEVVGTDEFGTYARVLLPGTEVRFCMRLIPAGRFFMGSPDSEEDRYSNEGPRHEVTVTQAFWLADAPCTQALYEAVIGSNPSKFRGAERPVEAVSWYEAQAFIEALSRRLLGGEGFGLPSEAQWEYACRSGTTSARYGPNLDDIAWWAGNSGRQTHPVRQKEPNRWGLYDTLGNVWEWCQDGQRTYTAAQTDPNGAERPERVIRGGSWVDTGPGYVRAAYRFASVA